MINLIKVYTLMNVNISIINRYYSIYIAINIIIILIDNILIINILIANI